MHGSKSTGKNIPRLNTSQEVLRAEKLPSAPKLGHVPVLPFASSENMEMAIGDVFPSPENNTVYHPLSMANPDDAVLVKSVRKNGILEAIMPRENEKDLPDIPDAIKSTMKLNFVDNMDEVLKIALEREIVALPLAPAPVDVLPVEETRAH